MINYSLHDIKKITNDRTFRKGFSYYSKNRVHDLRAKNNYVVSTVKGTKDYEVIIRFDPATGNLLHTACDCPAYQQYPGACKHIVATLLKLLYNKEKLTYEIQAASHLDLLAEFEKTLTTSNTNVQKQQLDLDITIEPKPNYNTSFSIRIGVERLYVVKDFYQFFKSMKQKEPLYYGQQFTYNPTIHYFKEEDQLLLDIISDFYDTYRSLQTTEATFTDLFLQNHLPENYLKKILQILQNKPFHLKHQDFLLDDPQIENHLNMDFYIKNENKRIKVGLNQSTTFFNLTKDFSYIFYNNQIIHLNDEQRKYYQLIHKYFSNNQQELTFLPENKQKVASVLLPFLGKIGTIHIDENVKDSLYLEDLVAELFLDRENSKIKGSLKFNYGDYQFGIYPPTEPKLPSEIIIVRDLETENQIFTLLRDAHCKVNETNDFFTIEKEEELYEFIYYYLPHLQNLANVYYSDDFKNLHIQQPISLQGGIRLNEQTELLEINFEMDSIDQQELSHILHSLKEKKKYYKLRDGRFLQLETKEMESITSLIDSLQLTKKELSEEVIQLPKYRALSIDQMLKDKNIKTIAKNESFRKIVHDIKEPSDVPVQIPVNLEPILRDYQKFGFKWLKTLSNYGLGGILADDMGLGKTIQAIALIQARQNARPSLVVAPTSLIYNWEDEVQKFASNLKVTVISGTKENRMKAFDWMNESDVVITSYGLLKRDIEFYLQHVFEYCFLDEAQHIKNPNSQNAKAAKRILAKNKFALTGTPIENSLTELWSIFDFIMPGFLYSHHRFMKIYERPIIKEQNPNTLETLIQNVKPFLLRRLKTDVLKELPPKIETKLHAELKTEQKKIYLAYLQEIKKDVQNEIQAKGYKKSTIKILSALTRLRQICCHPSLFLDNYHGGSAKLDLLEEIVKDGIDSGHRILIFSQFTSMLEIIRQLLDKIHITSYYLSGSTKPEERREMVHEFNKGEKDVFLISLKAGGTGLNLTGADMVIHYDPWWNPATEDQATDRAYRIGQNKSVQVMKLITTGTIEDKIFTLQQQKKHLIESVIQPGETMINKLSEEEIMQLFDL